jgi:hypothetical protein
MSETAYLSRRLVLKHADAEREVQAFASDLGWPRTLEEAADPAHGKAREIMWAPGPALSLHYLEDPVSRQSYLVARSDDREKAESLASLAEKRLAVWQPDELLAAVDEATAPVDRAVAVIRSGLGSPDEFDDRFFRRIRDSMSHPDRRIREAALYATAYSAWPQYLPLLERAAHEDPDEERRNDARILVQSFRAEGAGS